MNSSFGDITDVPGLKVGHAQNFDAKTGVTVILPPPDGACAGVHIGGSAPSTRQVDSLRPLHVVNRIHGICLCGGSAFGLDATGGVLAWLEEHKIGFPIGSHTIPIVPSAAIFDIGFGSGNVRPDANMGRSACMSASSGPILQGSIGVGTGATVGKLLGIEQAMKGGVGSSSRFSGDLVVGGLVVVNAYGDVCDADGTILAGCRTSPTSLDTADAKRLLIEGKAQSRRLQVENTTLAVMATNAKLDKTAASRIASQITLGLGSVIRPFHSHVDGDLTIVVSVGELDADPNRIALLGEEALRQSAINAVKHADGLGLLPAWKDISLSLEI